MPYTNGFISDSQLAYKFDKHVTQRHEFNYATAQEYGERADEFLGGPLENNTSECFRTKQDGTQGDKIRYNSVTQEFGILGNDNVIRSFFKPTPGPKSAGGHGFATNEDYFLDSCTQQRD